MPKLLKILDQTDCVRATLTSADAVRVALKKIGADVPPSKCADIDPSASTSGGWAARAAATAATGSTTTSPTSRRSASSWISPTWHVLGHSWGGLLAQLYAEHLGARVRSLVLSSSSLGVGADWKATKRQSFRIELGRAGAGGTLRFYLFGSLLFTPDPFRRWGMRHVMTETWHDYFVDPRTAPDPDRKWLDGCCPEALLRTDHSLSRADRGELLPLQDYPGPVLVLYGAEDIFGESEATVRGRFPRGHPGHPRGVRASPLAPEPDRLPGGPTAASTRIAVRPGVIAGERAGRREASGVVPVSQPDLHVTLLTRD